MGRTERTLQVKTKLNARQEQDGGGTDLVPGHNSALLKCNAVIAVNRCPVSLRDVDALCGLVLRWSIFHPMRSDSGCSRTETRWRGTDFQPSAQLIVVVLKWMRQAKSVNPLLPKSALTPLGGSRGRERNVRWRSQSCPQCLCLASFFLTAYCFPFLRS